MTSIPYGDNFCITLHYLNILAFQANKSTLKVLLKHTYAQNVTKTPNSTFHQLGKTKILEWYQPKVKIPFPSKTKEESLGPILA